MVERRTADNSDNHYDKNGALCKNEVVIARIIHNLRYNIHNQTDKKWRLTLTGRLPFFIFLEKAIDTYIDTCYNKIVKGEYKMKSHSSREVIQALISDGWYEVSCAGSHHQFKHPTKQGRVTVKHPHKDIPIKTLASISKQSGIQFK